MSIKLRAEIEQWTKDWSDENSFDPGMEGLGELHAILDQDAIRTATPTPTPALGDVIAGVLSKHQPQHKRAGDGYHTPREHWVDCSCGLTVWTWQQFYEENPDDPDEVFAAHQARAAVSALEGDT